MPHIVVHSFVLLVLLCCGVVRKSMFDGYRRLLRLARERQGCSLAKIAKLLGVNKATVSRWERGLTLPHPCHRVLLEALFSTMAEELGLLWKDEEDNMAVEEATPP